MYPLLRVYAEHHIRIGDSSLMPSIEVDDRRLSWYVATYYVVDALNITIKHTLPLSDAAWRHTSSALLVFLAFLMLWTISPVLKRSLIPFAVTEGIVASLYGLSILQSNAESSLLLDTSFLTLGVCIPLAMYVYSIRDKKVFYSTMLKASYMVIITLTLVPIMAQEPMETTYSMSYSAVLLLPALFQMNEFFEKKRFINLTLSVLSCALILLYGARGPLLSIGALIGVKTLLGGKATLKRIVVAVFGCTVAVLSAIYLGDISITINEMLQSKGIRSRTIMIFAKGASFESAERNSLFRYYWQLVKQRPLGGWGLLGGWIKEGSGPHNMLLEFVLAFGLIVGGILCLLSIVAVVRAVTLRESANGALLTIYCAANATMFFIAGDFLSKPNWFIFVAMCYLTLSERTGRNGVTKGRGFRYG